MAVYACSDLHGMMDAYKAIKEKLNPEDKVFYLGDAGDRGPEPWETIKAVLRDPQFIYIKGNHEDMLCDALADYINRGCPDYHSLTLLLSNGGEETFDQAIQETNLEGWYRKLFKLDTIREYTNDRGERVVLSHAGFTPWKDDFYEDNKEKRDVMFRRPKPHDLIWDRDHIFDEWTTEKCVDCYIVHGHTPIPYLLENINPTCQIDKIKPGALWYCNGHKVCIDCGCVFTSYTTLLNLDTFNETVIVL